MQPNLELKEFFTPGKTLDKAHVILHLAEPNAPHERERGYLFAVIELTEGTIELIETFQKIIAYVEERYYDRNEKTEYLLERILQAVNRDHREIFSEQTSDIHCLVGTMRDDEITMSYHGNPTAVVFYKNADQLGQAPIITEPSESTTAFFSEMITGNLNAGDFLYAATPHVSDYFPLDRVAKLLTDRTILDCGAHMQKVLAEMASDYSFGGVLFHMTKKPAPTHTITSHSTRVGSEDSLNRLVTSATHTAETLSPPILGDVKKTFYDLMRKPTKISPNLEKISRSARDLTNRSNYHLTGKEETEGNHHWLAVIGKTLFFIGRGLILAIAKVGIATGSGLAWLFYFAVDRRRRLEQINQTREWYRRSQRKVLGLPLMTKIILGCLILTMLAFVGSLGYLHWSRQNKAETQRVQNLIQAIHDKKDQAEASLLYEDKAKAQTLLSEADALLNQLPNKNKNDKTARDAAAQELLALRDKMRNEKRVTPELITDLSVVNSNVKTMRLTRFDGMILAFGPHDDSWYLINTVNKHVDGLRHDALKNLIEASVTNEEDLIVFRSTDGNVAEYDTKAGSFVKKTISFPTDNAHISAFDFYNRKLYTIDEKNKKIYRHNQTQAGYDKGTVWNKSGESRLGGVVSLAIDGDLYALKANGEVRKWFRGEEQGFSLAPVDPILDEATEIATDADATELFIVDGKNKRVLVFDKNGGFVEQLTSEIWKTPSSVVIQDKGKTLFVLDDNKVYRVTR